MNNRSSFNWFLLYSSPRRLRLKRLATPFNRLSKDLWKLVSQIISSLTHGLCRNLDNPSNFGAHLLLPPIAIVGGTMDSLSPALRVLVYTPPHSWLQSDPQIPLFPVTI